LRSLGLGYRAPSVIRAALPSLAVLCACLSLAACGGGLQSTDIQQRVEGDTGRETPLGFPILATKNTTRVPGEDAVQDAAAVATAVYPGFAEAQRPQAVTLVDRDQWQAAIAASVLMASPVKAPVLLTDGQDVPEITAGAIERVKPRGAPLAARAQAFRIGNAGAPDNLRALPVRGGDPYELAAAIDAFNFRITGTRSGNVIVTTGSDPRYAMPAASWAAKSGDAVLFTARDRLPAATRRVLQRRDRPSIYVLGPASVISQRVLRELSRLGPTRRIGSEGPVPNAISFARYSNGGFGWSLRDPGHGMVVARTDRPLDAAAAAALAGSGTYGPLLLTDSANVLPPALGSFLLDIQPGYQADPVRGVYNHAWLLGDESTISAGVQGKIDELAEIVRVRVGQQQ
jgi:putative cell wall binding repeat protein